MHKTVSQWDKKNSFISINIYYIIFIYIFYEFELRKYIYKNIALIIYKYVWIIHLSIFYLIIYIYILCKNVNTKCVLLSSLPIKCTWNWPEIAKKWIPRCGIKHTYEMLLPSDGYSSALVCHRVSAESNT